MAGSEHEPEAIREAMLESLPRYMVPGAIHRLETLPQNVNGKVDRRALVDLLESGRAAEAAAAPETVA